MRGAAGPSDVRRRARRSLARALAPIVRGAVRRLERDALALRLAADRGRRPLQLQADYAGRRVASGERAKLPHFLRRPALARTTLVFGIGFAATLPTDRRSGTFPGCLCHVVPPKTGKARIAFRV